MEVQRLPAVALREIDFDAGNITGDLPVRNVIAVAQISGVEGAGTAVGPALRGDTGARSIKDTDGCQLCTGQVADYQTGARAVVDRRFTGGLLVEGVRDGKVTLIQRSADVAAEHEGYLRAGGIIEGITDKGSDRRLDVGVSDGLSVFVLDIVVAGGDGHHHAVRRYIVQTQLGEIAVRCRQVCVVAGQKILHTPVCQSFR